MAAGSRADNLVGDCLEKPLNRDSSVRNCIPFREFCVHTMLSGPYGAGTNASDSGVMGCGKRHPQAGDGTGELPVSNISWTTIPRGAFYGKTSAPVVLRNPDASIYFDSNDLQKWRLRPVYPQRFWYAQGPPVEYAHLAQEVRRRLKRTQSPNNGNYQNRNGFYWTDAQLPHDGNGKDWLGALHPAGYMWCNKNVPEPFLAEQFYEDSGHTLVTRVNGNLVYPDYSQAFIPFCDHMPVRNALGVILGYYVGYTCIHYVSSAFIHMPVRIQDPCRPQKRFMPDDYYVDPRPDGSTIKVNPTNQLMQVETAWYIVGTDAVKSPRIGATRHWFYNKPTQPNGNPCDDYFYIRFGGLQNNWRFNVAFNVIQQVGGSYQAAPSETIKFDLSGLQVYLTP